MKKKKRKSMLALIMSLVLLLTLTPLYQESNTPKAVGPKIESKDTRIGPHWGASHSTFTVTGYTQTFHCFEHRNAAEEIGTEMRSGFGSDPYSGYDETDYQSQYATYKTNIDKALWYGYGGAGYDVNNFENENDAFEETGAYICFYLGGNLHKSDGTDLTESAFNTIFTNIVDIVKNKPAIPSLSDPFTITPASNSITLGTNTQTTDVYTVTLDSRVPAYITLPTGVSLVFTNRTGDTAAHTGTVAIKGGDKFKLTAPASVSSSNFTITAYTDSVYIDGLIAFQPLAGREMYQSIVSANYVNRSITVPTNFTGTGNLTLKKSSSNPAVTNGNACYDLAGAKYSVTNASGTVVATFTTNSDGQGIVESNTYNAADVGTTTVTGLPSGAYTIKETQAPTNGSYNINTAAETVTISGGVTTNHATVDTPANDPLVIRITKTDSEGNIKVGPSLAGAEFTIKYYAGFYDENTLPANATRTWVLSTKYSDVLGYHCSFTPEYKVGGNDFYMENGKAFIPLGTITIEETKAPFGYSDEHILIDESGNEIDNGIYIRQITSADVTTPSINTYHDYSVEEVPIRTKLMFMKTDWETRQTMAGVPFRLSLLDADGNKVESHIIVTDDSGMFDSSAVAPTTDTNGNDNATPSSTGLYDGLTPTGVWFSGSETAVAPSQTSNSFPCGTYMLEELPCTANLGRQLITPLTFNITSESTVNLGNITNVPTLSISTVEKDGDEGGHLSIADNDVTIVDEVTYNFLTAGRTYTLLGLMVDKESGEVLKDNNDDYIVTSKVFTTSSSYVTSNQEICGTEEVTFNFDGSNLEGKTFVVYQYLYEGDKSNFELVSEDGTINVDTDCLYAHDDINNEYQTGYFPSVGTKAWVTETETNVSAAKKDLIIKDEVTYTGLNIGSEYKLEATLVDYETGDALTDENGNVIKAVHRFTPTESAGTEVVTFPAIDGSQFEDKKIVVFEGLYWDNKLYASHMDIEDTDQTIYFPKISTTAIAEDGSKFSPRNDNVTITDIVEYSNLKTDVEYELRGVLMSAETKEAVLDKDGNKVVASKKFTPTTTEGTVELKFTFDATLLEGDRVVVFESVYYKDIEVCTHADITDEDQSVDFPELETELTNKVTDSHNAYLDEEVILIDTCEYKNLVPGEEYVITGVLMNKDTGNAIMNDNQVITSSVTFVPEKSTGVVEVEFKFNGLKTDLIKADGTYSDIVCFETIYYDDIEFCVHADLEDDDQTVYIAELDTIAVDAADGSKYLEPYKEVTITDSVYYSKLDTSKTYILEGILMTKDEEGNVIEAKDKDGNPIKATKEFTPSTADGVIYMNFTFDSGDFINMNLTVFQRVYEKDTNEIIAIHEDINDKDQTVTVSTEPVTGDNTPMMLLIIIAAISLIGLIGLNIFRRKA